MFLVISFLCLGIITYIFQGDNEFEYSRKTSIMTLSLIALSAILDLLFRFVPTEISKLVLVPVILIFILTQVIFMVIVNKIEQQRRKADEQIISQIFECLKPVLPPKLELDFKDLPFEYVIKNNQLTSVTMNIDAMERFTGNKPSQVTYALNKYFPYVKWVVELDFPAQRCDFISEPLPPDIAKWPGSDMRNSSWIPIGVNGKSELGWNLKGGRSDLGASSFSPDLPTLDIPSAPQLICVGATGGGKAIWTGQVVNVQVRSAL